MTRIKKRRVTSPGSPCHKKESKDKKDSAVRDMDASEETTGIDIPGQMGASVTGSAGNTDASNVATANLGDGHLGEKPSSFKDVDDDVEVED
eukprot:15365251-Ditylum_brightwellii.AAC.1